MALSYAFPGPGPGFMPYFTVELDIPERPYDIVTRHWNRIVKESLRAAVEKHHKKRIPLHFRQDARHRYRYMERSAKYRKYKLKRFGSTRDLVKTGASEQRMKNEREITIGGSAEGGRPLNATLRLHFDFTKSAAYEAARKKRFVRQGNGWFDNAQKKGGVNIHQMRREIQAWTPDERREFAEDFFENVFRAYTSHQAGRKRIRYGKK